MKTYQRRNVGTTEVSHLVWRHDGGESMDDAREIIAERDELAARQWASHFHSHRDGWEVSWPVTVRVWNLQKKTLVDIEVYREMIPEFEPGRPTTVDHVLCAECGAFPAACTGLYNNPCTEFRDALGFRRSSPVKDAPACEVVLEICEDSPDKPACDLCCDHDRTEHGHCHPLQEPT